MLTSVMSIYNVRVVSALVQFILRSPIIMCPVTLKEFRSPETIIIRAPRIEMGTSTKFSLLLQNTLYKSIFKMIFF